MALKLITAASALAVSLVEAKAHLRVDVSDDDTLISALVTAATEMAEQYTGRAIMPQTYMLTLDAFPSALELTRTPVASVTSIAYADTSGTVQTLSSSLYALDNLDGNGNAYVVPAYNTSWPDTRDQVNALTCTFVAGYANAAAVPESIKSWIKLMAGAMYDNRSAEGEKQTYTLGFADRLLDRYKVWAL
jgi:uncharacterized phiE125 gp8 family phage protein